MTVPAEAITAAVDALLQLDLNRDGRTEMAERALEAAAPLIAAAERDRIIQLAEQHQAYTTESHNAFTRDTLIPFAALLRREP